MIEHLLIVWYWQKMYQVVVLFPVLTTVRHSLIFSNVSVNSYSTVTDSVLLPEVEVGQNCRISKAIIEKGCIVPEGTVIGEDKGEKRFQVSLGGIILVTPEMFGQERHRV